MAAGWPDYNSNGLGEWAYRKKLGGPYRKAPVMIDKIQAIGTVPNLTWSGSTGASSKSFPFANHRNSKGISIGGNFLYEDGSVLWRKFDLARLQDDHRHRVCGRAGLYSIVRGTLVQAPGEAHRNRRARTTFAVATHSPLDSNAAGRLR